MSSDPDRRRPRLPAATAGSLLLLLAGTGCGLKGDPLPPIRPPDEAAEEVPAPTEAADEGGADARPAADDSKGEEDGERDQGGA